jgi:hypothetical protein
MFVIWSSIVYVFKFELISMSIISKLNIDAWYVRFKMFIFIS